MDGGVSGRSSYGRDDDEEKPTALHHHHRPRLEGTSRGNITAVKVEKGRSHDEYQQGKETLKMEISSSGDLDSSSTSLNQNHEQNDRLESARAEMSEVKEENERLKMYLDRIMREYKALQMHFFETLKQGDHHENKKKTSPQEEDHHHTSLSLGPTTAISGPSSEKNKKTVSMMNWESTFGIDKENLELSLNYCNKGVSKSETMKASSNSPVNISPENSFEDQKEETDEFRPTPAASKVQKRSGGDDEVSQQNAAKKTRVSVRARCDTPTMHDGCQWRKYGQKISKGNPCPRAYYRCTIAPSCPVRKQVQRCAEDMSILTTTYEGSHNHPLPVSATAMASTTSAAASMLLSGSSSSPASIQGLTPNATTDLHGLNFYLSDPSRSKQFYLPNPTPMSSSAPTHPTITLDLTNSNPNNYSSAPSSNFGRFGSSVYSPLPTRSYDLSTSVSFGSPEPISDQLPISWGNGLGNYGQLYPRTQPQETFLHHLQNNNHRQQDSIAAATKAITTDPNFQSALATALKSIIGGSGSTMGNHGGGGGGGDGLGQRLRWNSDSLINSIHGAQSTVALQATVGCGSSFLNNSSVAATPNSQQQQLRNLVFKQPSLPLSNPKNNASSTSSSPNDTRDNHSKLL